MKKLLYLLLLTICLSYSKGAYNLPIGQSVVNHKVTITLTGVSFTPLVDINYKKGHTRCDLSFTILNEGSTEITISSLMQFSLKDSKGYKQEQIIISDLPSMDDRIVPGDKLSGTVSYRVAVTAKELKAYFTYSFIENNTTVSWIVGDAKYEGITESILSRRKKLVTDMAIVELSISLPSKLEKIEKSFAEICSGISKWDFKYSRKDVSQKLFDTWISTFSNEYYMYKNTADLNDISKDDDNALSLIALLDDNLFVLYADDFSELKLKMILTAISTGSMNGQDVQLFSQTENIETIINKLNSTTWKKCRETAVSLMTPQ
jgi:hypothetical protein